MTIDQILTEYNNGRTIVLHTNKDTLLFKLGVTCCIQLKDVLHLGMYRHNQFTHGRVLK